MNLPRMCWMRVACRIVYTSAYLQLRFNVKTWGCWRMAFVLARLQYQVGTRNCGWSHTKVQLYT